MSNLLQLIQIEIIEIKIEEEIVCSTQNRKISNTITHSNQSINSFYSVCHNNSKK